MQIQGEKSRNGGGNVVARLVGIVAVLVPVFTSISLWLGLGLRSGAGAGVSLTAAFGLTLLPIAGLAAIFGRLGSEPRRRRSALAASLPRVLAASWLCSLAFWLLLPAFAPGARRVATGAGARMLLGPLPGTLTEPLATGTAALASWLGDEGEAPDAGLASHDRRPAHGGPVRTTDGEQPGTTDGEPPGATGSRQPARHGARPVTADAAAISLPYQGDGRMLDIEVTLDGPEFGERMRMVFDTGASFTTLTPGALERIDVRVPADAPRVELNTAGGRIEAPLVLLDAVWLGDQPVEWVTVAVCASCTAGDRAGLLGLNVSSQFRVEIDHARKRIHLEPRPGDRRHDVRAWVAPQARALRHGDDRIEFEVTLRNRAPRAIEEATVEIACGASGYAVQLLDVPARGEGKAELAVPIVPDGPECETFALDLLTARWQLDRF